MVSAAEESRGEDDASHGRKGHSFYALLTLLLLHDGKHLTLEQVYEEEEREGTWASGENRLGKTYGRCKGPVVEDSWHICGAVGWPMQTNERGHRRRVTGLEGLYSGPERGKGASDGKRCLSPHHSDVGEGETAEGHA